MPYMYRAQREPTSTTFRGMEYYENDVFGWGTSCERCDDQFFVGDTPEDHYELRHEEEER